MNAKNRDLLGACMKPSDANYLGLRRAIALEQLIVRPVPFDRQLTAACTPASSVNNNDVTCRAATTGANGTNGMARGEGSRWRRLVDRAAQASPRVLWSRLLQSYR
jgi:hypothetical protein